jgi:cytochrome c-type biogenesis protein CcmH/NrfG
MRILLCAVLVVMFGLVGCKQKGSDKQVVAPPQVLITAQQIDSLRSIAKMNPGKADGWIALGNALMDSQQFNEAVDAYQKALAIDPKNVDVRVDMGTCMRGMGKPEAAVAEFRKALKIAPSHLNAHRNLGVVLGFDLKDREGAVKELKTLLELAPNLPDAAQIRDAIAQLQAGK